MPTAEQVYCGGGDRHKGPHIVLSHLYELSKIGKSIETEIPQWSGGGILSEGNENILKLTVEMAAQLCEKATELYSFNG